MFISWVVLVLFWFVAVISALIADRYSLAVALTLMAVLSMLAWNQLLRWMFGVRRLVRSHLRMKIKDAICLDKTLNETVLTDLRIAVERQHEELKGQKRSRVGVVQSHWALQTLRNADRYVESLKWTTLELEANRRIQLPTNAIYFLNICNEPCVVQVSGADEDGELSRNKLEVFSRSLTHASAVIETLQSMASRHSMYRGKMISIENKSVQIYERPMINEDRIVLPAKLLELIKRSVVSRIESHDVLQNAGHNSRTGVLLHGSPGTGKTLVSKLLISLCPNHTAIIPISMDAYTIGQAFEMANYLQPAIVVIDDVDLLAERRETNRNLNGLQELMNELDGMLPSTQAIVLMSTNRPEVLEPALASRPGRISQAIFFPLPDAETRERLFRLFTAKADMTAVDIPRLASRTHGASPAFIEELVKKAIVFAAMRSNYVMTPPIALTNEDFDEAIHELVVLGGTLTSSILGFGAGNRDSETM